MHILRRRPLHRLVVGVAVAAATVLVVTPARADHSADKVVRVAHPAVTATLIDNGEPGTSAGDVRTYWTPLTRPKKSRTIGTMSGSLLTTAVDRPRRGFELRTADLVFSIGRARNQLVIGGIAKYRQQAATLTRAEAVIRPVIGGSGRYAGAHGWAKSVHKRDGTWCHIFHIAVQRR